MTEIKKITDVVLHIDGLKAVIFDLDDTLYSEKEYVRSGYYAVAQFFKQIDDLEEKLWLAFLDKKNSFDEVLKNEGIYTDELKQMCLDTYRQHNPNIHLYNGVKKMLMELHQFGYKIGIITDGRPEGQRAKIKSLELDKYIDKIIITDELGGIEFRKPNEKAFVMMKEYLNVDFQDMCYVGDNLKKDFTAPNKLGMKTFYFNNPDGLYYQSL